MKVMDICKLVAAAELDECPHHLFDVLTVIHGRRAFADASIGWLYAPDDSPPVKLAETDDLSERFMSFDYVGHYPIAILRLFESESDLVAGILEPGGYFNPFTSFTLAICDHKVRRFACTYRDQKGQDVAFDKKAQGGPSAAFGQQYCDRRLLWLD